MSTFRRRLAGMWFDVLFLSALLVLLFILFQPYYYAPVAFDEGVYLWDGWNVLRGELPYRDFFEWKPLMLFVMNVIAVGVFGIKNYAFRWWPFVMMLISTVLLYVSFRRMKINPFVSLLLGSAYIYLAIHYNFHDLTLNDTETYGIAFAAMAFAFLHWNRDGRSPWYKMLAGVMAACAVNCKEPFLFVVAPMLLANYVFERGEGIAGAGRRALTALAGGVSLFVLLFLYLLVSGTFDDYLRMMGRLMIYVQHYASGMGITVPSGFLEHLQFDLTNLWRRLAPAGYFLFLVPFYLVLIWRRKWLLILVSLVGVALGLYAVTLGHTFWRHYFVFCFMGFLVPAFYGAYYLRSINRVAAVLLVAFAAGLLFVQLRPAVRIALAYEKKHPPLEAPAPLADAVAKYTRPGDPILLLQNPFYYVLVDRDHSFSGPVMLDEIIRTYAGANDSERMQGVLAEIEGRLPRVVFLELNDIYYRQQRHIQEIVVPLLQRHPYRNLGNGVFVLFDGRDGEQR